MMNCDTLLSSLAFRCNPVSDSILYVESPHTYVFDGELIGAYLITLPSGAIKITDNADLMFHAMMHGVKPHAATASKLRRLASAHGIELSSEGELYATSSPAAAPFVAAKLFEASIKIAETCNHIRSRDVSKFESIVGKRLRTAYGRRVKTNQAVVGASGHTLRFPFVVYSTPDTPAFVQPISAFDDKPYWPSVYGAVGKMLDLKNARPSSLRYSIMQPAHSEGVAQAAAILSESTTVLTYSPDLLLPAAA